MQEDMHALYICDTSLCRGLEHLRCENEKGTRPVLTQGHLQSYEHRVAQYMKQEKSERRTRELLLPATEVQALCFLMARTMVKEIRPTVARSQRHYRHLGMQDTEAGGLGNWAGESFCLFPSLTLSKKQHHYKATNRYLLGILTKAGYPYLSSAGGTCTGYILHWAIKRVFDTFKRTKIIQCASDHNEVNVVFYSRRKSEICGNYTARGSKISAGKLENTFR